MSLLYCCCRCVTGKAFTCRARYAMDQGWIRLTPNPFSPLYDDVSLREAADEGEEVYPGELSQIRRKEVNFRQFVQLFQMVPLPRDNEHKEQFDSGVNFLLRDPIPLRTQDVPGYRTKDRFGSVDWVTLFTHLISLKDQVMSCDTVYLLVDNRDMSKLENTWKSIPHWPPAAAWWASRVPLVGPYCEKTEVVSIQIGEATGLAKVHPTWAGTFVLAGMVALYPSIHFALIDNDCLPLTLFEISELWHLAAPVSLPLGRKVVDEGEGVRATEAMPLGGSSHPPKRARREPHRDTLPPQGVILFTEPHSELNAGLVVICASRHQPILDLANLALPATK